jgi:hypothetical protein
MAFELLVEVSGAGAGERIVGPYVYRSAHYAEPVGNGGTISADFRDGSIRADLAKLAGAPLLAQAVIADFIDLRVPATYPRATIDIPWFIELTVTADVDPVALAAAPAAFRLRILSGAGTLDHSVSLPAVLDGTLGSDGHYRIDGVFTLPAADVGLSTYELFVADLAPGLSGALDIVARAGITLPDGLEFDIVGCSLLALQAQRDSDGDGFDDATDNCKRLANPAQVDADGDGIGNRCDGDFNNDAEVTMTDLGHMRMAFFGADPVVDMDSDGIVNTTDLGLLRRGFLATPGPSCAPPQDAR